MTLKIEAGRKYRTRGGDEVEILRTDVRHERPVAGVITYPDSSQIVTDWCVDGHYWRGDRECEHDLISEIKPKRVVWLNVYWGDVFLYMHSSRKSADEGTGVDDSRIACIRVEFEEGQFDD